ncbi:MAG TPA: hypothetical protein DCS66_06935, partial [Flavobacteriaceae bacterium]|nr:hypothetical protein [Flavobacteriaceae bacterium]
MEVKSLTKKEQADLIENNPAKTWGLYARDGFSNIINLMSDPGRSNPQLTKIDGSPIFTKEEIELFTSRMDTLKKYLFQGGSTSFASPTTGITSGGAWGGDSIASSQYKNIIEGYLQGKKYGNVPPLPPELLEKLLAGDWLEKGLKDGLINVQEKQLNRATKPLYNTIMSDLGEDETLLELAKRWEGLPTDMLKDEIKEKIDRVRGADANIVEIFDFKINEIWNNLPKGSRLNYTDINGDVVAEIAWEGEGTLS